MIALAGNKADLTTNRVVEYDEASTYAEENGLLFMETSAKTELNVNKIFFAIAKKLQKDDNSDSHDTGGTRLTKTGNTEGNKMGHCCSK